MIRRAAKRAALCLGLLVAAPWAALAGAPGPMEDLNDTVHTNNTSQPNVTVVEDTWKRVKIKHRTGPTANFPVHDVQGVDYGDRVTEYEEAREAMRAEKYQKAARLYANGLKKTKGKNQHQYFIAGLVDAYQAAGDVKEMRKAIRRMVGIKPAPRLIYDVYLKLGASFLREGDFAGAEKAFDQTIKFFVALEKKAMSVPAAGVRKKVQLYVLKAKYGRIFSLEKQDKIEGRAGAQRAYDLFTSDAASHRELVHKARIAIGRCLATVAVKQDTPEKKARGFKRAIDHLKRLIDPKSASRVSERVLPAAYVALGDIYFNKLDYPQARWYYLKVTVRYAGDRAALARAHYQAGRCYEALSKGTVRERDAVKRALRHYKIVGDGFRDSLEHSLAKDRLQKLGA